jgi:hypothetical protein
MMDIDLVESTEAINIMPAFAISSQWDTTLDTFLLAEPMQMLCIVGFIGYYPFGLGHTFEQIARILDVVSALCS